MLCAEEGGNMEPLKYLGQVLLLGCLFLGLAGIASAGLPAGFVYLDEAIPGLKVDLRYTGSHNFVGRPVEGYQNARPVLSSPAAVALVKVQADLKRFGLGLLIFDAYRPQ